MKKLSIVTLVITILLAVCVAVFAMYLSGQIQTGGTKETKATSADSDWKLSEELVEYRHTTGLSFKYPKGQTEIIEDGSGRLAIFMLFGPSQIRGEDFTDGIFIELIEKDMGGASLSGLVYQSYANEEYVEKNKVKEMVLADGTRGFMYDVGDNEMEEKYFIQKDEDTYLRLTFMVKDPLNKNFRLVKDGIVESLKLGPKR